MGNDMSYPGELAANCKIKKKTSFLWKLNLKLFYLLFSS